MPLYEYYCHDCRKMFNTLRSIQQADAPIRCYSCESEKTRRALSLFATQTSRGEVASPVSSGGCSCGGACACGHGHN